MGKKVLIIGGGILGLSTAYYCIKEGYEVEILDQGTFSKGASYVNAGFLTPSHIIPLAAPGMITKGLKWMFNSSSPFYMKPRIDKDFFRWAWQFYKASTHSRVRQSMPRIAEINLFSKSLYEELLESGDLGEFQLEKTGLLMLFKSEKEALSEQNVALQGKHYGLEGVTLDRGALDKLQPGLSPEVKGAIHWTCDAHTSPDQLMARLKTYLKNSGVQFRPETRVEDFEFRNGRISAVRTNRGKYASDNFVMASGAWSQLLFHKLQIPLQVEGGKGYRIDVARETGVRLPAVLMDAKVAVTPMTGFTRFAGTMEFSGLNHKIRLKRVQAIAKAAKSYYTDLEFTYTEVNNAQCGLRPVTPDGLPYIGLTKEYPNLNLATGHAMMGWSLGPATGKLVSELISGKPTSIPVEAFSPQRRF